MNYENAIVSTTNKSQYVPVITPNETRFVLQRAKDFESKLSTLGCDEFIKRHQAARNREVEIFEQARFEVKDRNPNRDEKFDTPRKRFDFLLGKVKEYQKEESIKGCEADEAFEYENNVENLIKTSQDLSEQLDRTLKKIAYMFANKSSIIKRNTLESLNKRLKTLEKIYNNSQNISDYHKGVESDLENGYLP